MGVRGVIASEGEVMAPSMLGKLKTAIQFLAIALAILRPGDPIAGLYVDEWAMLAAAAITVWSAVDYLVRAPPGPAAETHEPRLPHRRQRAASAARSPTRLAARGDEVVALARSDAARRRARGRGVNEIVRGDTLDEDALADGMSRLRAALPRRRHQHDLRPATPALLSRQRPRRRDRRPRRRPRRRRRASCSPPRPPRSARRAARSAPRTRPHRGSYLSVYERSKHEGELAAFAAARAPASSSSRSTRPRSRARAAPAAPAGS